MTTVESYNIFEELAVLLANLPPRKVLAFKPSERSQARVNILLEKNKRFGLDKEEEAEFERYMILEHIIRMAKAKAAVKQSNNGKLYI